jgi:hypothetical protein
MGRRELRARPATLISRPPTPDPFHTGAWIDGQCLRGVTARFWDGVAGLAAP